MGWTGVRVVPGDDWLDHVHDFPDERFEQPDWGTIWRCDCGLEQMVMYTWPLYFDLFNGIRAYSIRWVGLRPDADRISVV